MFLNNKILLVATKTETILLFGTSSCLNFSKNNDMHDKCDSYLIRSEMFPVPRSTSSHSCLVQYVNIANYAFSWAIELNPRTYTQSHTIPPPPRSWVFDMYLWSSLQGEVYFMGGGAAGGLLRHQHGRHLGFCKELQTSKNSENSSFFVLNM